MPTWDQRQYLRFSEERTRPAIDLAGRVEVDAPRYVIDLGCGPGNSTRVLRTRWPSALLSGVDNSASMLGTARQALPNVDWIEEDISQWRAPRPANVIFSNAALQWVQPHDSLLLGLLNQLSPGGALAVQIPANQDTPPHRVVRELAASSAWSRYFTQPPREWHVHSYDYYYDLLAPRVDHLDIWVTTYIHFLNHLDDLIEWYRGSGLRSWLDALPDHGTRNAFINDFRSYVSQYYQPRANGSLLFPFTRLFFVAYT